MPPALADPARFDAAKRLFDECGFNERGFAGPAGEDDAKALLASLFLQAADIPKQRADEVLPAPGVEPLLELGLVELVDRAYRAAVLLYPLAGLHIASDFPGRDLAGEDFVFPAISQQTWEYLSILPDTPCDSFLEIGTGSGAAALLAARYARAVTATDISPRCLHFAEFNRRLNAVEGVRFLHSDVFDALPPGETYDRIAAHPPYVPWTGEQEAYRHGGPDGEAVLRRVLAGLEQRLRPGGTCHLAAMGLDTRDTPLEHRIRGMLEPMPADLLVAERETLSPLEFVLPWKEGEDMSFEEAWGLSQVLQAAGATALVRCSILIGRPLGDCQNRTFRRRAGPAAGALELAEELARERREWSWESLLAAAPELAGEVQLETLSLPSEEGWQPRTRILESANPFVFRTDCPQWTADLLPQLDGRRTLGELLEPLAVDPEEAEILLACLFDAGVLHV